MEENQQRSENGEGKKETRELTDKERKLLDAYNAADENRKSIVELVLDLKKSTLRKGQLPP